MTDEKGILAKVFSKGGVDFNQGDELIFMDQAKIRRSYRFIEMGEVSRATGAPSSSEYSSAGSGSYKLVCNFSYKYDLYQE